MYCQFQNQTNWQLQNFQVRKAFLKAQLENEWNGILQVPPTYFNIANGQVVNWFICVIWIYLKLLLILVTRYSNRYEHRYTKQSRVAKNFQHCQENPQRTTCPPPSTNACLHFITLEERKEKKRKKDPSKLVPCLRFFHIPHFKRAFAFLASCLPWPQSAVQKSFSTVPIYVPKVP